MKHDVRHFLMPVLSSALRQPLMALMLLAALGACNHVAQAERAEESFGLLAPETTQKSTSQPEEPQKAPRIASPEFTQGVKAYREGDYILARRTFYALHRQHPEDTHATYYLAITEAQLGRFQNAKKLYEEIITLDPNGEAAIHARDGLKYLPAENGLDLPPRFQAAEKGSSASQPAATLQSAPQSAGQPGQSAMAPQGLSQQDWMAWQMMMSQTGMGGNNNNGNNGMGMMPWMPQGMMPQAGGGSNNPNGYDPNAMSTMLMNQMLQNFSLEGNKDDNR